MVGNVGQRRIERGRVADDVLERLQLGHVLARFLRHVQLFVAGAAARSDVAVDGTLHIAFAPVVGRQGQVPVAEHGVQALQVVHCCPGGAQHVAAVIQEAVLGQFVLLARAGNELPHAGSLGTAHGLRVEGAFHERQQGQFGRHAAALQFFDHMEQVLVGAAEHAAHAVGVACVPGFAVAHDGVVQIGHGEAALHALPHVVGAAQAEAAGALAAEDIAIHIGHADADGAGVLAPAGGTACQHGDGAKAHHITEKHEGESRSRAGARVRSGSSTRAARQRPVPGQWRRRPAAGQPVAPQAHAPAGKD